MRHVPPPVLSQLGAQFLRLLWGPLGQEEDFSVGWGVLGILFVFLTLKWFNQP